MRIYNFSLQLVLRLEIFIVDTHARGINCKTHFTGDYHFFGNLKINCPLIQYWAALSDCTGWLYSCQFNKPYLIIKLFCGISQLKALLIICIIWEKKHRNFVYEINFAINSPKKKLKKKGLTFLIMELKPCSNIERCVLQQFSVLQEYWGPKARQVEPWILIPELMPWKIVPTEFKSFLTVDPSWHGSKISKCRIFMNFDRISASCVKFLQLIQV